LANLTKQLNNTKKKKYTASATKRNYILETPVTQEKNPTTSGGETSQNSSPKDV